MIQQIQVSTFSMMLDTVNLVIVARVQFALKHLTAAAEAGYVDADVELCKVHQYLLARYEKSRKVRKSMILGQA